MAFFRHFFTFFKISKIFQNFKNELIFAPFCPFFDDLKKYLGFQEKYLEIVNSGELIFQNSQILEKFQKS